MAQELRITLNGIEKNFDNLGDNPTISKVVALLGFREDRVALERNGEIVSRAAWPATPVVSGDRVELVHFVGGGIPVS